MKKKVIIETIGSGKIKVNLLASGDIFSILYDNVFISMYKATTLAGGIANLYLRLTKQEEVWITPLYGVTSPSIARVNDDSVIYTGSFMGVDYNLQLDVCDLTWFWTINIDNNNSSMKAEVFYAQDVSLNNEHLNEAYVSQYLDHRAKNINNAYHVLTKQNQGPFILLQQGSLTQNCAYATDGFDFYHSNYKKTNIARGLKEGKLPSEVYQYELALIAFQSEQVSLANGYKAIFYGAISTENKWLDLNNITDTYNNRKKGLSNNIVLDVKPVINWQNPYPFIPFTKKEQDDLFLERELEEIKDGKLLSWFSKDSSHFVVGDKEDYLERAHGHIIMSYGFGLVNEQHISSSNYIFGVFNSQLCFGNTQFNRLLTYNKTPLNILKTSGQRLFIKIANEYHLLALPALYKMTVNSSLWYYKIADDILGVEVIADINPQITLEVRSKNNVKYDFILTNELVLADVEYQYPINYFVEGNVINFYFSEDTLTAKLYPEYYFKMQLKTLNNYHIGSDGIFFKDNISYNNNLLTIKIDDTCCFRLDIIGATTKQEVFNNSSLEDIRKEYQKKFLNDRNNFNLKIASNNKNYQEIEKLNKLAYWYTHNSIIHYAVPRGLEQYGGGAWGTRDVAQGPAELFTAYKRYDLIRNIIIGIYSRQFYNNGDWPQWFMFDRFRFIQADSAHADIIIWPLYLLGRYLIETGDLSILDEIVPYTKKETGEEISGDSIKEHVELQLDAIEKNLITGTCLSAYGGGDWNDTLQPKDCEKKNYMASGWTIALTIEALENIKRFYDSKRITNLAWKMKEDYNRYIIKDEIPAGFVYFTNNQVKHLLHPSDKETNIKYRLLSLKRGIIAELFKEDMLASYLDIIESFLLHPDGVRLMDKTVDYNGGNPEIFLRAETAANFGREIGLLYVHAHLRYCKALATLGEAEKLYKALKVINPILINENVPNALPRQSNVYFSSSDAAFKDRYAANKNFSKVKTGEIAVKGGWRLYSSGPGIWLNLLISDFLGVKEYQGELYIDPVLPQELNGLNCNMDYFKYNLDITYDITGTSGVEYLIVNGKKICNNTSLLKYRRSGVIVPHALLLKNTKIIVKM